MKGTTLGARKSIHDNQETCENNIMPESQPKRDPKLMEKGLECKLEIAIKERNEAHSKQVKNICSFLHEGIDYLLLENKRETLDSVKEYFNEAHQVLCYLSPDEKDKLSTNIRTYVIENT